MQFLYSVLLGLVGFALLQMTYLALRTNWPEGYARLSDTFELQMVSHWWRLLFFRMGPTFLVGLALIVTAWRTNLVDWLALISALVPHVAVSNGRAFVRSFMKNTAERKVNYASYHLATTCVVAAAGLAAAFIAPISPPFVPSPQDLVSNLWLAAFVGVVGGGFLHIARSRSKNQGDYGVSYFEKRALADAGVDLFDELFECSMGANADPQLMKAIMIAEVMQRPKWVRNLERAKGVILRRGSYGVMQVRSRAPISDSESIGVACSQMAGVWGRGTSPFDLSIDANAVWWAAGQHQGDKLFIDSVTEIYMGLAQRIVWFPAFDVSPSCTISEIRRYSIEQGLRGSTATETVGVRFQKSDGTVDWVSATRPKAILPGALWTFELRVPARTTSAMVLIDGIENSEVSLIIRPWELA